MARCPAGHESTDTQYCDVCGIQLSGASPILPQPLVRQGDLQPGTTLGPTATPDRYRIERKVGQGGFGGAYVAVDQSEGRRCVAKEMLLGATSSGFTESQLHEMFAREALLLSQLGHPGLPSVWDAFEWEARAYLVMSFVEGETLESLSARGTISEDEAVKIAKEVASILSYLHSQNPPIIHRDVSPDNIVRRSDGTIALLDFGAARFYDPGRGTDTVRLGKTGYAAPEAFQSQTDARADLYSLGAVLYRILLNHDPGAKPFSFPALGGSTISPEFAAVLERLVAINRDARFQSADQVVGAIAAFSRRVDRCKGCGRALDGSAWRCLCGRSLMPAISWSTIGGESTHQGSTDSVPGETGLIWTAEIGASVVGGAVGTSGAFVVVTTDGRVVAMEAATGREIWTSDATASVEGRSGPVLVAKLVMIVVGGVVWFYDLRSGSATRVVDIGMADDGELLASPGGKSVYIVNPQGKVVAVDLQSRSVAWRLDLNLDVRQPAAFIPDRLVVVGVHGTLACIDSISGTLLWSTETHDRVTGAAVLVGRSVVLASLSGNVRRYELNSGRLMGEATLGDQVHASPCVRGVSVVLAGRAQLSVVDLTDLAIAQHPLPTAMRVAAPVLIGTKAVGGDLTTGAIWSSDAESGEYRELSRFDRRIQNWLACVDGWVIVSADGGLIGGVGPT